MQSMKSILILFGLFFLTATVNADHHEYPEGHLLVDVEWLQQHLESDQWHIIDMRAEDYSEGHIPGAVNIEGHQALVNPDHEVGSFLVNAEQFEYIMGSKGVAKDSDIVIYDEGQNLSAARLFYALEYYGHEGEVRLLNGGFAAWEHHELPISEEAAEITEVTYETDVQADLQCDLTYITERMDDEDVVIFDARSPEEYSGEERRADRYGHIPGAVNIEWSRSLEDGEIPYFKASGDISAMLEEHGITPDKEVIPHCQSNVRGAHVYFTLRLMGYDSVKPYEGSWAEYGNQEGVPIEQ